MLNPFYKSLKSGTDIRGVASDGVAGEKINLTDSAISSIAFGFAHFLQNKLKKPFNEMTVSVGRDSRISGERIADTVIGTLSQCGINVINCGLSTTPSIFMTTLDLNCDAGVQITASHHPFNKNGLKFFTKSGGVEGYEIEEILKSAQDGVSFKPDIPGKVTNVDYMSIYADGLCRMIKTQVNSVDFEKPLKGFKIVVDAGNGAGGFYAEKVLKPLGADTEGSRYLEPDGMFPNHVPNPEDPEAMRSICEAVRISGADLGVIFDTDVDRGGAVDKNGSEINRNRLVAIASAIALEGNPGATIVTDSITSSGLKEFIETTLKAKHHRFKRGYKNVINEALLLNSQGVNCPLAIETSGHAAMRENYFLDDGAYLCTKIIIKMAQLKKQGESLEGLISDLKEPAESREIRYKITAPDFKAYGESVIDGLIGYAKAQPGWCLADDSFEGVRVSFNEKDGNGWFLLRLSVHDPIMPLNIESNENGGVDIILAKLKSFIDGCEYLTL